VTQIQISPDIALRETLIESEQRRNRVMVLAQQLVEAQRENVELKDRVAALEATPETQPASP
jgi:hypothetical protein